MALAVEDGSSRCRRSRVGPASLRAPLIAGSGHRYKDVSLILAEFIDVESKNGCLLLNVGPRADGTIPAREAEMLRETGAWLQVKGEAIYGSRPWKI